MSSKSSLELVTREWLEQLLKKDGIVKILSMEKLSGMKDGYLGETMRIKLNTMKENGTEKRIDLIIKGVLESKEKLFHENGVFSAEIRAYKEVIEVLNQIWMNDWEPLFPKCYGYKEHNLLVLEDLSKDGFSTREKSKGLSREETDLALRALARWHSATVYSESICRLDYLAYKKWPFGSLPDITVSIFQINLMALAKEMLTWNKEWHPLGRDLLEIIPSIKTKILQLILECNKTFNVLCHGDIWTTNFLYKRCSLTDKLSAIRMIDFQQICWMDSILDLLYFFYMSPNPEIRDLHLNEFLTSYHTILIKSLDQLGYAEMEKIPNKATFIQNFLQARGLGILFGLGLIPYSYSEEVPDMADYVNPLKYEQLTNETSKLFADPRIKKISMDMLKPLLNTDFFKANFKMYK